MSWQWPGLGGEPWVMVNVQLSPGCGPANVGPHAMAMQGMRVRSDGPQLISQMISKYLNIDCSVLMGANIAGAPVCLV